MELFPYQWIERIIAINSETHRSNAEVVAFLRPLLQEAGLKVQTQDVREGSEVFTNLIAYNQHPTHPDLLLFNTHLDTVSGGDTSQWTKTGGDPWKATRVRDRIYGLGTADVKIDFLCKLWAIRQSGNLQRPIALVGTYGEERGLVGVQKLFDEKKITPKYAVVGEPSVLELIYAHKGHFIGVARFPLERLNSEAHTLKTKGKAAHTSTPHLGVNALTKLLQTVAKKKLGLCSLEGGVNDNRVPESAQAQVISEAGNATRTLLEFVARMEKLVGVLAKKRDRAFNPSASTLSWNVARTDNGHVELTFDIRTLPGVDSARLRKDVEAALPKGASWTKIAIDLPLAGSKTSPLIQAASRALRECGVKPVIKTKASCTEAAIYHHYGAQAFVFGPGISVGNVHKPNEHNLLSQIRVATQFYQALLHQPLERS
ncbi:M20/M25/M40 family metallo-hydrolase [bacterium]|nr:M20/M25/M40 family metallo-hydrolase [bacterium]